MAVDPGSRSRKQPYVVSPRQRWSSDWVVAQHVEALWLYGEMCLFTMMWRPQDEEAGLVQRCSVCYVTSRSAQAFNQPPSKKGCSNCYGTTFEGGIRAQVIRPAIFSDRNTDTSDTPQGTVVQDSLQVETTGDFDFLRGDYIFRADGSRYQAEEKGEGVLRTGFGTPLTRDSFRGSIPVARLEDPTAVAFTIPPLDPRVLAVWLGHGNAPSDMTDPPTEPPPEEPDDTPTQNPMGLTAVRFAVPSSTWTLTHNLNSRPDVLLFIDSDPGEAVITDVTYPDLNTLVVSWPSPESGWIYY